MIQLREKIQVNQPIDQVFAYAGEFRHIEEWDPGVISSVKTTPGKTGIGTEYELKLRYGLLSFPMKYSVTVFQPPHQVVLEAHGKSFQAVDQMTFQAVEGGTVIDYQADFHFSGFQSRLAFLLRPWLARIGRKALEGLEKAFVFTASRPRIKPLDVIMDKTILPGMVGFSKIGFLISRKWFRPNPTDLSGKTVVLTGATSGIGKAAAIQIAQKGARLAVIARSPEKADALRKQIMEATGNDNIAFYAADLSLMTDIQRAAAEILEQETRIDVLINNAGALFNTRQETREGNEQTLATDLLGPFHLTRLLLPKLTENPGARIINVSSGGMYTQKINVDDLPFQKEPYEGAKAYARAKRGLVILTEYWADMLKDAGTIVHAMHPGWVETRGVIESLPGFYKRMQPILRNPDQGADTIVWLASSREAGKVTGKFWLDRRPHMTHLFSRTRETGQERNALLEKLNEMTGGVS